MTDRPTGRDGSVLVYATFPDEAVAERLGGELVTAGLAACVNLIPGMRSIYRWAGKLQQDREVVGIIKTRRALAARVIGWLRIAHPYTVPAAVVIAADGGSEDFLAWIASETRGADGS
jgi:periplasmic divalent cation tolerance protein